MYRAVLGDETTGKLVQEVASLAGHALVLARDQQTRLVAVGAPLLFARQAPLEFFQPPLGLPQVFRVFNLLAGRKNGEILEPRVHAHRRLAVGQDRDFRFAEDGRVVFTALGFRDGDALGRPLERTVENCFHPPDLRQIHAVAVELETLRPADGLMSATLLEARIPSAFIEEVGEGAVQILDLRLQLSASLSQTWSGWRFRSVIMRLRS